MSNEQESKTERAKHSILSALEDGLELLKSNPTGLDAEQLSSEVAGYVKQANQIAKRYGFTPYFQI